MPDTEQEIFESAMSDEAPAEPVATEAEPEQPEGQEAPKDARQRDEKGRFAPKEKTEEAEAAPEEKPPEQPAKPEERSGEIPAWRLREEAEAKREWQGRAEGAIRENEELRRQFTATQRQLNELQRQIAEKQNPPPDMYADPEGYQRYQTQSFEDRLRRERAAFNVQLAHVKFGEELVNKADDEFTRFAQSNPGNPIVQAVINSSTPAFEVVKWYQQQEANKRLAGKSIDDLLKEERDKLLNDPAFLAQAVEKAKASATPVHPQAKSNIPSLNRATAAVTQGTDDDETDASLFTRTLRG